MPPPPSRIRADSAIRNLKPRKENVFIERLLADDPVQRKPLSGEVMLGPDGKRHSRPA
jgi:hypothetical protein